MSLRDSAPVTRWRQATPGSTARRYDPEGQFAMRVASGLDGIWPSRPVNGLSIAPLLLSRLYEQGRLHARGVVSRALLPRPGRISPRAGLKSAAAASPSAFIRADRASMSPRSWSVVATFALGEHPGYAF